jgi:peptidoglycan/LPS O-acetylase OafA/YrhL
MTESAPAGPTPIAGESRHLPELDGVRGIAIFAVLISHGVGSLRLVPQDTAWGLAVSRTLIPLWGGVDLFFTLSGFLITGILLRSRSRSSYFRSFYARRALRIFPIYYGFLIFQLCLGMMSPEFHRFLPATVAERVSYFFYLQNWPVFWVSWAGMTGIASIYWSLAVEEQFYMVWPAVIRWVRPRLLLGICVAGFLLGWVERWVMIRHVGLQFGLMEWPFSRLDGLFLGASLALYQHVAGRRTPMAWAAGLFAAGAVLYGSVAVLHPEELQAAGRHLWTIGVTGFALMSAGMIAAAQHRPRWLHAVLTLRPLVAAGTYSYGMYVYHLLIYTVVASGVSHWIVPRFGAYPNPLIGFAVIVAAIALSMGVAFVSFEVVETRILSLKRYFPSPSAPV